LVGPEERIGDGCGGYYLYVLYVYDHVKRDYTKRIQAHTDTPTVEYTAYTQLNLQTNRQQTEILDGGRQQSGDESNAVYCCFGIRKQGLAVKNRK